LRFDQRELLYRRARQVDRLARFAISRVLEDDALLDTFKTDASIAAVSILDLDPNRLEFARVLHDDCTPERRKLSHTLAQFPMSRMPKVALFAERHRLLGIPLC
jgi:hypothetical protein